MTTALALNKPQLTPDVFQMINQVAPVMHAARLFGTKTPEQAMAIMIKGYELGFSLTASFENIHVIEDKPSLSPKGALAMILASPECAGITINEDAKGCTVTMKRRGGFEYTTTFTLDDAKRAGVVKAGSGWEKYPANMCRWRAIGYAADIVFPDVIGGTKRADEFGADLTPDGDVIEGSWSNGGSQPQQIVIPPAFETSTISPYQTVSQSAPTITLNDLVSKYGTAAILEANGGLIPGTSEECAAVAAKLGAGND